MLNLLKIDLSYTQINFLSKLLFQNLKRLKYLNLNNLNIKSTESVIFSRDHNLKILTMSNTKVNMLYSKFIFINLKHLQRLESEYFALCCFAWKYSNSMKKCRPSESLFNSCSDLLASSVLHAFLWLISVIGFIENCFAFLYRILFLRNKNILIHCSLIFADLGTSIFFICIGIVDWIYRGQYIENDFKWRHSIKCLALGSFCSFSLMFSTIVLLVMSIERYLLICHFHLQHKKEILVKIILLIGFLISILLSVFPNFIYKVCLKRQNAN